MTINFDAILQEVGQFGTYQKRIFISFGFVGFVLSLWNMSYVFTAGDLRYRCYIEGCDNSSTEYHPEWLKNAVPMEIKKDVTEPSRCSRYQRSNSTVGVHGEEVCPRDWFLPTTEDCSHWVYEGPEKTILSEWDLACDEVGWRLSLVGTVNAVGYMLSLPVVGYFSDRFGRRRALLVSLMATTVFGFCRSFSQSYLQFIIMEGLCVFVGAGAYASTFILALEMAGPDKRVLGGCIINLMDAFGASLLGLLAWLLPNWRTFIQVMYLSGLGFIAFYWFLPESVRWLLVKGRRKEAKVIILRIAEVNGTSLSEATLKQLNEAPSFTPVESNSEANLLGALKEVFRSRKLVLRFLNCCFCWVANAFVYYGLALNSVFLGGNKYVNFTLSCLIDLPGMALAYFCMDMHSLGRSRTLAASLSIAGLSCLAFTCVPTEMSGLILTLFLLGKLAICVSFSTVYAFTAEIFPTSIRNSLMGSCSMVGRIGSILATQTPSLARYMSSLPPLLFGVVAITSGVLSLFFPETRGIKLPDSVKASLELSPKYLSVAKKQDTMVFKVEAGQTSVEAAKSQ